MNEEDVNEEETPEVETPEEETGEEEGLDTLEGEEELILTIGDDEPEETEKAPDWVRELRQGRREDKKRIRELEAQLEAPKQKKLGPRPSLEDFDFDQDKYNAALDRWIEDKTQLEREAAEKEREREAEQQQWNESVNRHNQKKAALEFEDVEDAESLVKSTLSETQYGIIIHAAEDSAKVMYALSKYPSQLQQLASEKDAVKFTASMARMEAKMKTTKRRRKPAPETKTPTSGVSTISSSKRLDKAIAKAQESGDMSEVRRIRREIRQAG